MSDYQKIATAIAYLRAHAASQPSLDEVAAAVNLSPYHFQRLFSRWAGVSPKRFLQTLTLADAKLHLQSGRHSLMQTSETLGLSSVSRLHDHFVQLEAVTPAEFKSGGEGVQIDYGYHPSPYGDVFIAVSARGICQLDFIDEDEAGRTGTAALERLQQAWPQARLSESAVTTAQCLERVFVPRTRQGPLSLWVQGTNFQINVWKALLRLEAGQLASYGDIAASIGQPQAARAVGSAIGANKLGFVIPCHRVIQQSGALGGYRWGEVRKQALLVSELRP